VGVWDTNTSAYPQVVLSIYFDGTSMGFDEGQKMKVWLFVSWFFPPLTWLGGSWGGWHSKLGLCSEVRMVHPNLTASDANQG
jgi:hypothetical protein